MLSFEQARYKAAEYLKTLCRQFGKEDDLLLFEERISAYSRGWLFPNNTKRYIETRDPLNGLPGNRPIFVDKVNGTAHIVPTGHIDKWIAEYTAKAEKEDPTSAE